jgi:Cu+-exporting ATPase
LTVYQILEKNDLCAYYSFDDAKGNKKEISSEYEYLDNPDIVTQLLEFRSEQQSKISFQIPSIHCTSCIWLLEHLPKLNEGIIHSSIQFLKKTVYITFKEDKVSLKEIVILMASLGYAPLISLDNLNKSENPVHDRSIYYKLGIAGFAFGNIMLLNFPDYFGLDPKLFPEFAKLFGYFSILLAIPVLFYAASDYYRSAYVALQNKKIILEFPLVIGLSSIFLRSVWDITTQTSPGYLDSFTGLIFFLLIGKWYQMKTFDALTFNRNYQSYFPIAVLKKIAGKLESISLEKIKPKDFIYIRHAELIPCDSTLISKEAFIDYSFVTGESLPVHKFKGDLIYAGGIVKGEAIDLYVEKNVATSYLVQLWNQEVFTKPKKNSIDELSDVFSQVFTYTVLIIAASTFCYWLLNSTLTFALNTTISVLVVACPCALALSIPFCFGNSLRLLGKHGLFIKNAKVVEQLAQIDTLVFDKTGTITESDLLTTTYEGEELSNQEWSYLLALATQSNHPYSRSIVHAYSSLNAQHLKVEDFQSYEGKGIAAIIDQQEIKIGSSGWITNRLVEANRSYVAINGYVKGYFTFTSSVMKGFETTLQDLSKQYDLHVLSGDSNQDESLLKNIFPSTTPLNFNCSPQDKLNYILKLKEAGKQVAMIGDGLNDAGALKAADVGIAITKESSNFAPASDAMLQQNFLININNYITYTKKSMLSIKITIGLSIIANAVGLYFACQGFFTPLVAAILMPVASVSFVMTVILLTNYYGKKYLNPFILK